MVKLKIPLKLISWMIGFVLIFGLVACTPEAPVVDDPVSEPEIETEVPVIIETQAASPTPDLPPTVLMVSGVGVDPSLRSKTQLMVESLATDSGMNLVVLEEIRPELITPEVQVVIGLGPNLDLNGIAANTPAVSFVAIGDPNATVADNLSVIGDPLVEMRQQAFMAGYLSALISQDNKIAAIFASDDPASDLLVESYVVGARFLCGICQPLFPPYNPFPQWETLPTASTDDAFRPVINNFYNIGVEVIYVHGALATPELLAYIQDYGIKVISDRTPETLINNWIGTVTSDPTSALDALWAGLISGAPGVPSPAAIILTDAELGLVSEGRYRLFEDMVADLQAGLVSVEITP